MISLRLFGALVAFVSQSSIGDADTCNYFLDEDGWATPLNLCTFGDFVQNGTRNNESFMLSCNDDNQIQEIWYENADCTGEVTINVTYTNSPSYDINTCETGGVENCDWDIRYFYWCWISDGSECNDNEGCSYWPNYDIDCETLQSGLSHWSDDEWYSHNASWADITCNMDGTYDWDEYEARSCDATVVSNSFSSCNNPDFQQGCVTVDEDDSSQDDDDDDGSDSNDSTTTCNYFLDEDGWATPLNLCTFGDFIQNGTRNNQSFMLSCNDDNQIQEIWYTNPDCSGEVTINVTYTNSPSYDINTCESGGVENCDWDIRYFYWCWISDGSECNDYAGCSYWPNYDIDCETLQSGLSHWTDDEWYSHNASWADITCNDDNTYDWDEYEDRSCDATVVSNSFSSCNNPDTQQGCVTFDTNDDESDSDDSDDESTTCNYFLDEDGWATPLNLCTFGDFIQNGTRNNQSFMLSCNDDNQIQEIWYENADCTGEVTINVTYTNSPSYDINTCETGGVENCDWGIRYFYWCWISDGSECNDYAGCSYWPNYDIDCETLQSGLSHWTDDEWYSHNASWADITCNSDNTYDWDEYEDRSCDATVVSNSFSSCNNPDFQQGCVTLDTTGDDDDDNDDDDDDAANLIAANGIFGFVFVLYVYFVY